MLRLAPTNLFLSLWLSEKLPTKEATHLLGAVKTQCALLRRVGKMETKQRQEEEEERHGLSLVSSGNQSPKGHADAHYSNLRTE